MKTNIMAIFYIIGIVVQVVVCISKNKFAGIAPVIIACIVFLFSQNTDVFIFSLILSGIYCVFSFVNLLILLKKRKKEKKSEIIKTIIEDL